MFSLNTKEEREGWGNVIIDKNSRIVLQTADTVHATTNPGGIIRKKKPQTSVEEEKEENKQARPRPRIPSKDRGLNNLQIRENAPPVELLSALDKLGELILRRPILAGLIQLKNNSGLAGNTELGE
ncbi:hypothetical protein JTB14_016075 [Gonioctena quinquepunctata]|nr:hypothetical protein JTB14_016075 [Gonioctena quinquepunctata]